MLVIVLQREDCMFKEEGVMKKSDLKDGMVVDLRTDFRRTVLHKELLIYDKGFYETVSNLTEKYCEDLTHRSDKNLDIIKVYDDEMKLIWQREEIDWSEVPVDTKVLVGNLPGQEIKRYFAKYEKGVFYAYVNGCDSWSDDGLGLIEWEYCKLAGDPKEKVTFDDVDEEMKLYCKENNNRCDRECSTCGMRCILDNYNVTRK